MHICKNKSEVPDDWKTRHQWKQERRGLKRDGKPIAKLLKDNGSTSKLFPKSATFRLPQPEDNWSSIPNSFIDLDKVPLKLKTERTWSRLGRIVVSSSSPTGRQWNDKRCKWEPLFCKGQTDCKPVKSNQSRTASRGHKVINKFGESVPVPSWLLK